jgi:hypothetical protein
MENKTVLTKNVLTIGDLTAAILNGEMTTLDAANMFEKQLNASIEAAMEKKAAEDAARVREENINKSAVKVMTAVLDFLAISYPDLIPEDFVYTEEMANEAAKDLRAFAKEVVDALPDGIFKAANDNDKAETVKCVGNVKAELTPAKPFLIPEVDSLDELLDELVKANLLKVKPTCEHENLKKSDKEDNISKFLREIGL